MSNRSFPFAFVFCALGTAASSASADEAPPAPVSAPEPAPSPAPESAPKPAPAPYSLPFQLRPVTAASAVRLDTSFAKYENAKAQGAFAVVSELTGAYRIPGTGSAPGTGLAPLVKLTVVGDSPPPGVLGTSAFVNPLVGAAYAMKFDSGFRASGFLAFTIPIGMGGGDTPDKGAKDARTVGVFVRSGLDNSLFAVNDFAVIPGLDFAYVGHDFTAQLEVTYFELARVRGAADQHEATKRNLTGGLHLGYFLADFLSLGAELRYQHWLNAPIAVDHHTPGTSEDLLSMAVGPRFHFKLGSGVWMRPGLSYARGFDAPMTSPANAHVFQLDVPVVF
jgi:hypothetical protein